MTEMRADQETAALEQAVSSYLAGYRGETVRAYTGDLKSWTHWCTSAGVNPVAATRAHIETYARYLEDARDLAPATVARRITTVCSFYRHCTAEGVIDRDPGQFVRRPHVPTESRTLGLTYLEFVSFLHAAAAIGPEANGLANLLGMLGLRVSEACGVDIGDLGEERGHRVVRVIGKGRKPATIPSPSRSHAHSTRHGATARPARCCSPRPGGAWIDTPPPGWSPRRAAPPESASGSPRTACVTPTSPNCSTPGPRSATFSSAPDTPTRGSRCVTTGHGSNSTDTSTTSSPPALPVQSDT